jgi:hypothetical protein
MKLHGSPVNGDTYIPTGTIWPSGDFSVGSRKVAGDDRTNYDIMGDWESAGALDAPETWGIGRYGIPVPPDESWFHGWEDDGLGRFLDAERPLDLTDAPNSHTPANRPESYGRQGMTGYGKKMIRSACALLERSYTGRLTFCTVTMPTLPLELRILLAEAWPALVREGLQWLSRQLERQGLPRAICSVSEIQPKRLQAGNGGYLHLHLVWPNKRGRKAPWAIDVTAFRSWIEGFLCRRGLMVEGSWVNVDTKLVRVSAAAYLSKYMSKGGDCLAAFVEENGWSAVPAQWWNMTKPMRDAVKRETVSGDDVGAYLDAIVNYAFDCDDFSAFWSLRHVDLELEGRLVTVGWYGILKSAHQREAVAIFSGMR